MKTCSQLLVLAASGVFACTAQHNLVAQGNFLSGDVYGYSAATGLLNVELIPATGRVTIERELVASNGRFQFPSVQPGLYILRVLGAGGAIIHEEEISTGGRWQHLTIRVEDEDPNANRPVPGTISAQELAHRVPMPAQRAFSKGRHAAAKGKNQLAVHLFREALAADPEYINAYVALGSAYFEMGDLRDAAVQFQTAIELAPRNALALEDLTIVLAKLHRYDEAILLARRALAANRAAKVHFVLAVMLTSQHRNTDEALDHFRIAVGETPRAHVAAAELLLTAGRKSEAVRELEDYLAMVPVNSQERQLVTDRLEGLGHLRASAEDEGKRK